MNWKPHYIHGTSTEKQLLSDVRASRSFTSRWGKTSDVQMRNQLLAYMQYFSEKELLEEFLFTKTHVIRKALVWFGSVNDYVVSHEGDCKR